VLGLSLIVVGVDAGRAQDIAGIEDCTKTSGLDKRTGCLQPFCAHPEFERGKAEYLMKLIVAPQRGYDEPAILSYAISSFCPTNADGLHLQKTKSLRRL